MHNIYKFSLVALGLSLATSPAAHAQLGVGTGTTTPRTMLDVNGAIATYETSVSLTGASPAYTVAASVGQLLLNPGSSAPTGTIMLTADTSPAPVAGQRLVVVNATPIPAILNGQPIPASLTIEFVYSANAWRASGDGGRSALAANGLTKNSTTNTISLGGTLTSPTDIALAGNSLTFSGTGTIGIGTTPTQAIDVNGTARLRAIPSGSGTVMLTADNNGVIRQQALPTASAPTIIGTLGNGVDLTSSNWTKYNYTGSYITIPANSKYIVQCYILLAGNAPSSTQSMWVRTSFSDSPSGTFVRTNDVVGSSYLVSGLLGANAPYSMLSGAIIINNTSASAKTYYYYAGDVINVGTYTGTISGVGRAAWIENQLFATPIN